VIQLYIDGFGENGVVFKLKLSRKEIWAKRKAIKTLRARSTHLRQINQGISSQELYVSKREYIPWVQLMVQTSLSHVPITTGSHDSLSLSNGYRNLLRPPTGTSLCYIYNKHHDIPAFICMYVRPQIVPMDGYLPCIYIVKPNTLLIH
jgi:hypothetical protein